MKEKTNKTNVEKYRLQEKETERILRLSPECRKMPRKEQLALRDRICGYFRPSGEAISLS